MSKELQTTLVGAASGAIMAFLVSAFRDSWRRWRLYRKLRFEPQPRVGARGTARIHNGYVRPLNSVYAYITIDYDLSDVLDPPHPFGAYVTRDHLCRVLEDRLCWSTTMPSPNPPVVDIYAGERQALDIANFGAGWIEIPSERGWATSQEAAQILKLKDDGTNDSIKKSRVFLRAKKYVATIKIISKDTKAKEFAIEIDPESHAAPIGRRSR